MITEALPLIPFALGAWLLAGPVVWPSDRLRGRLRERGGDPEAHFRSVLFGLRRGLALSLCFTMAWYFAELEWFWFVLGVSGGIFFAWTALVAWVGQRFGVLPRRGERTPASIRRAVTIHRYYRIVSAVLLGLWLYSWSFFLQELVR